METMTDSVTAAAFFPGKSPGLVEHGLSRLVPVELPQRTVCEVSRRCWVHVSNTCATRTLNTPLLASPSSNSSRMYWREKNKIYMWKLVIFLRSITS